MDIHQTIHCMQNSYNFDIDKALLDEVTHIIISIYSFSFDLELTRHSLR